MSFQVSWIEEGCRFDVEPGESVLDGALRCGVPLPSECRFGGCGTCRVKLVEGTVTYLEPVGGLTPDEAAQGYALACQARPTSHLVLSTERSLPAPVEPAQHRAEVASIGMLSHDVCALSLRIPALEAVRYRPGQYVEVRVDDGGGRCFSMASKPHGNVIELHIRRIPGGYFTDTLLGRLRAGDGLDVTLPLGGFGYHEEDFRPIVLGATGTGIAPLKSMLEALADDPACPPIWLYWGCKGAADLYVDTQIRELGERFADFVYVPVLSEADAGWTGRRGYVQQAMVEDLGDLAEYAVYLCGAPVMIRGMKSAFIEHGGNLRYLYTDSFDFSHARDGATVPGEA
ncbi:2Fe-2S iron-sulfur cluster-binding protein [Paraburkholderia acidipaludis]|uniref:2Fe-2S iron-sulfur cluster-binding protein n=1 Tax=Paraburkholderia acidipaludis TaxID=660537 RepID=UPI0004859E70|nr:2Fe-2S iron-sulfur cluster-binding protein [Paraburkholderia acidipaludis]